MSQVRAISNGRVLVNDILARRVLMFDSTLQRVTVVVDTMRMVGGRIAYRGDTTLSVNPALVSMLVIDGAGAVVRTMAIRRLWIRTSKLFNGGAVYDVVDKSGELVDRVAVPQGRVIAGFGPGGVVYMGVLVGSVARVERARVR